MPPPPPPPPQLAPHQTEGVAWMMAREGPPLPSDPFPRIRGGILGDEMGLGKTHMIAALMARCPMQTLVVASIATMDHWFETLRRHGQNPCCVLSRDHATTLGPGVVKGSRTVVTTVSALSTGRARTTSIVAIQEMLSHSWGRVVLDEAHVIRNPDTQVHKTMLSLNAAHRWAVTGTPMQNREGDLQALAAWLGAAGVPAKAVVSHLLLRRQAGWHCRPESTGCPDLTSGSHPPPPIERVDVRLEFPVDSDEAHIYGKLHDAMMRESRACDVVGTGDPPAVVMLRCGTVLPVALIVRCRQAASHPRLLVAAAAEAARRVREVSAAEERHLTPLVRALASLHTSGVLEVARIDPSFGLKARWLVRDLSDAGEADPTTRSLVFCDWVEQMHDLRAAVLDSRPDACVQVYHGGMSRADRRSAIGAFSSAPSTSVLLIQIQCGAVGLNLQAANRVYLLGPQWNPSVEMQAIGRAYRLGQTRVVTVLHLAVAETVDVQVVHVQDRKRRDIIATLGDGDFSGDGYSTDGETT